MPTLFANSLMKPCHGAGGKWINRREFTFGKMGLTLSSTLPPIFCKDSKLCDLGGSNVTSGWDNLCINQENIEEKNHQVAMMDEIYAHARHVCIWLGEASNSSRIAMDFIEQEVLQQDLDSLCEREDSANKRTAL
jgi:hypothetical protein